MDTTAAETSPGQLCSTPISMAVAFSIANLRNELASLAFVSSATNRRALGVGTRRVTRKEKRSAQKVMVTQSSSRKTRGRGLRTTKGCLTCRKRHLKCDETKPSCKRCITTNKTCTYAAASIVTRSPIENSTEYRSEEGLAVLDQVDVLDPADPEVNHLPGLRDESPQATPQRENLSIVSTTNLNSALQDIVVNHGFTSPGSHGTASIDQPVGVATARWLDMLAGDAQIDLDSDIHSGSARSNDNTTPIIPDVLGSLRDGRIAPSECVTFDATALRTGQPQSTVGVQAWQSCDQLALKPCEESMFTMFVTHVSSWLDLFDPCRHFSTLVPRLALYNVGLLSAIMALTIRFQSLTTSQPLVEQNDALLYYHSTLQYVARAMQYQSYQTSDELLATALIVSTYEMLDGSSRDWEKHLQGVFWIQRAQVIHGDTGGFRGANWWTWLCQDTWAAFREKRRVFTFWKPQKTLTDLTPIQLAARSIFNLAKVINYCADKESRDRQTDLVAEMKTVETLTSMLDAWRQMLTPEFQPIPHGQQYQSAVFLPIWIHPPMFAVSVQAYHAARLLILLNKPNPGGIDQAMKQQATLHVHADAICSIALTLSDYASSIISSQCIFYAGLCTYDQQRRDEIMEMLEDCRARSRWPRTPLQDDLKRYWDRAIPAL